MSKSDELQDARRKSNKELLKILTKIVELSDGHLRFSQILAGYGFVTRPKSIGQDTIHPMRFRLWDDEFYTEPNKILKRVKKEYKRIEGEDVV